MPCMRSNVHQAWVIWAVVLGLSASCPQVSAEPIAIAAIDRTTPVDFATEIHPLLKANCQACHNAQTAEAGLSLQSPASILKGGESGPAVVPGKPVESLLLKVASHQNQPQMPPADNDVSARNLTSHELGLLRLWISQGASGSVPAARRITWRPKPSTYQPIFATDISPDGIWGACGRAHRLFVYHLPSQRQAAELRDPALANPGADLEAVRALAFSRDGQWLASGGFRSVRLWRAPHIEQLATWKTSGTPTALAIGPQQTWALTGNDLGKLQLWDLTKRQIQQELDAHLAAVTAIAFSADGESFYTASLDKDVIVWSRDGSQVGGWKTPSVVHTMVALPEPNLLLTAGGDHVVRGWDLTMLPVADAVAEPNFELAGHTAPITCMAPVPNSSGQILTGSEDGTLRRWDLAKRQPSGSFNHQGAVAALAIHPDGTRLASASSNHSVKLWNLASGALVGEFQGDGRAAAEVARIVGQLAFTKSAIEVGKRDIKAYAGPERRITVTKDAIKKAEGELEKAEAELKKKTAELDKVKGDDKKRQAAEKARAKAETDRDVAITVVQRAKAVAARSVQELADANAAVAANEARFAELEKQQQAAEAAAVASAQPMLCVAFSPDGKRLIAADNAGLLHVLDPATADSLETIARHATAVPLIQFAANNTLATVAKDGQLVLWKASNNWTPARTIGGSENPTAFADRVLALDFAPGQPWLVTGSGLPGRSGELKIWDINSGNLLQDIAAHSDTVFGARFAPDGKLLASVSADQSVQVFEASSWQHVRSFAGHTAHVLSVDWSADGRLLATASTDRTIKLWNFETGVQLETYKGKTYGVGPYKGDVTAVRFVGNSEQILASSGDGTARLHRTSSTDDLLTFNGSSGYLYSAAVSSDGRFVLAGGADGNLWMWSGQNRNLQHCWPIADPSSR